MSGKIRWRNSTAMVAVTIVSLIASLSSVAFSARPAAAVGIQAAELESQPWCADVLIVGVAGSAQEGYGPEVGSAVAHLKSQINPYKKVRDVPLDYPAAGISTLLGDIATPLDNHWGYFESVGEGQIALLEVLGDSALHCPDEQWILAGYSQGALVINQAGMYLTTYPNRVAGILMIAEPTRTPYNGRTNHGTAHSGGRGISQAFNTYPSNEYPPELDSVTVDVCMESDIVCDYSNWLISLLLPQAGAAVHTSYPEALITAAADSLVPHMPTTRSSPVITDGGREAVAVRWVDSIEHGFPITGYRVQVTKQDNTTQVQDVSAAAGEARFGNIRGGEIVTARVAPLSGLVAGEWSPPSIPFKVLPTEPYSDFNHIGYLGSTTSSVTIRWAYPQHDGGSPVTEYRIGLKQSYPYLANAPEVVTMVPGHLNTTVLEGLPPGTSYLLTVNACNAVGCARDSEHRMVLTFGVAPPAPTAVEIGAISPDGALISWTAPVEAYPTVSSYKIVFTSAAEEITKIVQAPATSLAVTGLRSATKYLVAVSAENHIGWGEKAIGTVFTTLAPPIPDRPDAPAVSLSGSSGLQVSWSAPTNAGPPITSFEVTWTSAAATATVQVPADSTTATIQDLDGDLSYSVTVSATNAAGTSPKSPESGTVYVPGDMPQEAPSPPDVGTIGGPADVALTVSGTEPGKLSINDLTPQRWYFVYALRPGAKQEMPALGWYLSDDTGQIVVTIPDEIKPGNYRIAVQTATGTLLGSSPYRSKPAVVRMQP